MTSRRMLMPLWEGGGNLPPQLGVARRLVAAGHEVHIIAGPLVEERAREAGCGFTPWRQAPHSTSLDPDEYLFKDWELSNPFAVLKEMQEVLIAGPADAYAAETLEAIEATNAEAVVGDYFLFGAMMAAEAAGIPALPTQPNVWMIPTEGMPPVGPGVQPARSPLGKIRDRVMLTVPRRILKPGLERLNEVRDSLGLSQLEQFWDQVLRADRLLMLTSPTFDYASSSAPSNVAYVGPILDEPAWTGAWNPPWSPDDDRPLVLVGFSTIYQDQLPQLRAVVEALDSIEVRGVVTTGPALDNDAVPSTDDVAVVPAAPHSRILEEASAVVTHCGHGTTIRSLAAGVPLVCMPMGRDQLDTAARVLYHGAGTKVAPKASPAKIANAVREVIERDEYRTAARRLAGAIAEEMSRSDVVGEITQTVGRRTQVS